MPLSAKTSTILRNSAISAAILLGATLLGILLDYFKVAAPNIIMVYILGVVVTSVVTTGRVYSLVSAIASVLIFNFLFATPRFTLLAYETGYPLTFVTMFITAYITGTLAIRYKEQAQQAEIDIRAREEAALRAERERLRTNLLRSISHDLRTPLTTISGNASNLLTNGDALDDATRTQLCSDIYDDSIWLTNLVENLLAATRIEDDRMNLRLTTEVLGDIIDNAIAHVRRKLGNHKLVAVSPSELLLVKADAGLIVQVIVNIIDNAVKYTPDGSTITISTGQDGSFACVRIADDGPGIPDGEKGQVFDEFYCGGNHVEDSRRGIGLGLYLSRAIVEAHDGQIFVTDKQPHGSVFNFTLPLEKVMQYE